MEQDILAVEPVLLTDMLTGYQSIRSKWTVASKSLNDTVVDGMFSLWAERAQMRTYRSEPVPEDCIAKLEIAAGVGPRTGNPAMQHLVFVSDALVLKELKNALCKGLNRVNFWVRTAPLLVVALSRRTMVNRLRSLDPERFDLIQALERVATLAQAEGLGSCPVLGFDGRAVQSAVAAPPEWKAVAVLAAGYPGVSSEEILGLSVISDFNEYYHRLRERLDFRRPESMRKMLSRDRFRGGKR